MTQVAWPVKIKVSSSVRLQWYDDEEASWEDLEGDDSQHVYKLLERQKTQIVVNSLGEAKIYLRSAGYHGDSGGWDRDERSPYRRALGKVAQELRQLIRDAKVALKEGQ